MFRLVVLCVPLGGFLVVPHATAQQLVPPIIPAPQPAAQAANPIPLSEALETRGDLSLQDVTIEKALFTIGASWRVNIVVGKDVQGSVSCIYRQAPLREVLDAILLANGYSYRAVGESLVVQKSQEVGSANPLFESAAITITHSDVKEVLEGARLLLSKQGRIKAMTSARSILVVDYIDRVASVRDFVARMDAASTASTGGIPAESYQRLQVMYLPVQYIPVENATAPIATVLSAAGRVAAMPMENRLVVVDYASNIAMVRRVLAKIDRPVPQVRITALIYDISLQDVEDLGFNWSSIGKGNNLDANGNPQQLVGLGSQTVPFQGTASTLEALGAGATPLVTAPNTGIFALQSLSSNFDIGVVAQFLQNANDARLLANPNITVMDNETADMSSIQEIPYQQLTSSTEGSQGIATTAFKEVGVKLNVTPSVAADGTIKMVVEQEFNRVVSLTAAGGVPTIDTRRASTTVRVANRNTLVIGGLRQRSDTGDFNGIPFLKDVRFIGPLFRSRNTTVRESELIVFLMPEIVGYDEPGSQREYLAQETVNCRLARVPMAEGCSGPNGFGCSNDVQGEILYDQPVALPPIEGPAPIEGSPQNLPPAAARQASPTNGATQTSLRKPFGERYRAESPVTQRLQTRSTEKAKKSSNALSRLFRPGSGG